MKDKQEFYELLGEIDGREFSEYNRIIGDFDFSRYVLKFTRVPTDASEPGALFVIRVPSSVAGFPPDLFSSAIRRTALEDLLARKLAEAVSSANAYDDEGIARRRLFVPEPGQKILPRSTLVVAEDYVEARLTIHLPARRGRILGEEARHVFFHALPDVVNRSLIYNNLDEEEVARFVRVMEDADAIRQHLPTRGLIAFVGEGSRPDRAERADRPANEGSVPLAISDDLAIELEVPNAGRVRGLGIRTGITVILGNAHSGRVALMKALAAGIYNHVPGDGREFIISHPDTVYISSERGRPVQRVDISAFIRHQGETAPGAAMVCTASCADSFTSQAASTAEALEAGARALLFDESDADPSFLSADARLEGLLPARESRAVPLSALARKLADDHALSIVVAGSSSVAEFLPIADTVLRIDGHRIVDVTREAKQAPIARADIRADDGAISRLLSQSRWVVPSSLDPSMGRHDAVIGAETIHRLQFGHYWIELGGICQLADLSQVETIGLILYYVKTRYLEEGRPVREILELVDRDLSTEGLECLTRDLRGDLARPRRYEIAAALNRLPSLRISRIAG